MVEYTYPSSRSFCANENEVNYKGLVYDRCFRGALNENRCQSEGRMPKRGGYIVLDNEKMDEEEKNILRAVRIVKVIYGNRGNTFFVIQVAGKGYTFCESHWMHLYASKEDYANGKTTSVWEEDKWFSIADRAENFGKAEPVYTDTFRVCKWGWENNELIGIESKFIFVHDVATGYGEFVSWDDNEKYPYKTKEEAIEKNEVKTCEFEDEMQEKTKEVWVEVLTDFQYKSNLGEEDVKKKIRETFGGKNYRAWINGELVIEDC